MRLYVDPSAFVKLLVRDVESDALKAYLAGTSLLTSAITPIEVGRSIRRRGLEGQVGDLELFIGVEIREIDMTVSERAASLQPVSLRTLDAIHLASAIDLRTELDGFVTYEARLADAARALRLPVVAPA
jgi:predicted nucleic acid-binding protein